MNQTNPKQTASHYDPLDFYLRFVGHLIDEFVRTEFVFRQLLREEKIIGTSALVKKMNKKITALSLTEDSRNAVILALSQFSCILPIRHRIVHWGGNPIGTGQFLIRTRDFNLSNQTGEPYDLFSREELEGILHDLRQILAIVMHHLAKEVPEDFYACNYVLINPDHVWKFKAPGATRKK